MKRLARTAASVAASLAAMTASASAQTEIQWWHAMAGDLGQKLEKIATDFNASQKEYKIVPVFKGTYPEAMTGAIAAFRAKQQPAIVQVFEVGTATMMAAKGAIYPVYELMKEQKVEFDPAAYLPAISGYYSDTKGNMLSFPFNSSTPIFFYNKDLFKKAGLDPDKAPTTWEEVAEDGKKLRAAGVSCGFTTGWPSWVQVENLSTLHNIPIGTQENGLGGLSAQLTIANELVEKHWTNLAQWQKDKVFDYGGRQDKSGGKFLSGECGMEMQSSGSRGTVLENAKFQVGFGMLPVYKDVKGAPQNSIIGGATLWVLKGRPAAEYKGVAEFFQYLSKPDVQAWWHQNTGYLPITKAAFELTKSQGFYDKNPGSDVAVRQINLNPPTANSKGLRFGNFAQIRDVIEEEMENMLTGKKTPKAALEDAQRRGNDMLRQFEKTNS
jgi:sn-glycerol 3-phosphate transport system substrate-binding protein